MEKWLDEQEELDEKHERKLQRLEKRAAHKGLAEVVCMHHWMLLLIPPPSGVAVLSNPTRLLFEFSNTPFQHHQPHTFDTMFHPTDTGQWV